MESREKNRGSKIFVERRLHINDCIFLYTEDNVVVYLSQSLVSSFIAVAGFNCKEDKQRAKYKYYKIR